MTKLDSEFWGSNRPAQPANGGEVRTGYAPATWDQHPGLAASCGLFLVAFLARAD